MNWPGRFVKDLSPGVRSVGYEQVAVLAESKVLDVLELALGHALRADVHHMLELQALAPCGRRDSQQHATAQNDTDTQLVHRHDATLHT